MAAVQIIIGLILAVVGLANIIAATTSDEWTRGNERVVWFGIAVGLVFFLPGLLMFIYGIKRAGRSSADTGNTRRCPFCAEMVKPEATVCRYCQRALPMVETPEAPAGLTPNKITVTCPHCHHALSLNPGQTICSFCRKDVGAPRA